MGKKFDLVLWIFIIIYMLLIVLDMITAIKINGNYWDFVNIFGLILFLSDATINFDKSSKSFSISYITIVIFSILFFSNKIIRNLIVGIISDFSSWKFIKYNEEKRLISYVVIIKFIDFNRKYIKPRKKELI